MITAARTCCAAAVVTGVVVAASPVGAAERTVGTTRYTPEAGPVLAGEGAAWVEGRADDEVQVRLADGRGGVQSVARHAAGEQARLDVAMAGSRSWLAVAIGRTVFDFATAPKRTVETFASPLGEGFALSPFSPACPVDQLARIRSVDADGERLASPGPECGQGSLATPGGARQPAYPPGTLAYRVAGRFVAWSEGEGEGRALVVVDTATGEEVTRVLVSEIPVALTDYDLDADGTLAVTYLSPGEREQAVAIVAPGAPGLRELPGEIGGESQVRIAGGRVLAFGTRPHREHRLVLLDAASGRQVAAGRPRFVEGLFRTGFDWDGERMASIVPGCYRVAIVVSGGPPTGRGHRARCRLRLTDPPVIRGGRLRFGISCAGFQRDCIAMVTVRLRGRTLRGGTLGGGLAIRLDRAARRALARRPVVRITAAYGFYVDGRPEHGAVRRTATVRVRR